MKKSFETVDPVKVKLCPPSNPLNSKKSRSVAGTMEPLTVSVPKGSKVPGDVLGKSPIPVSKNVVAEAAPDPATVRQVAAKRLRMNFFADRAGAPG
jgi:hypothetical protein